MKLIQIIFAFLVFLAIPQTALAQDSLTFVSKEKIESINRLIIKKIEKRVKLNNEEKKEVEKDISHRTYKILSLANDRSKSQNEFQKEIDDLNKVWLNNLKYLLGSSKVDKLRISNTAACQCSTEDQILNIISN
jgi:septal ring factor EnvC (AmiA/AmiB activator)